MNSAARDIFNKSKLNFDLNNLDKEQFIYINLYDISGKLIFSKEISTNNNSNTNLIADFYIVPGCYIISIQSKDGENLFSEKYKIQ